MQISSSSWMGRIYYYKTYKLSLKEQGENAFCNIGLALIPK